MNWKAKIPHSLQKAAFGASIFGALLGASSVLSACDPQVATHYTADFGFEVRGDHRQPALESFPAIPLEELGMSHTSGVKSKLYTIHDMDYIFLDTFKLTAVSGGDLAWLGRVRLMLESPGLPTLVLAFADGFGAGQTSMNFQTNDDELWEYFKDEYRIYFELEDSVRPRRNVQLRIDAKFNMRVNIHAVSSPYGYPGYPM